jgi:hypothetical protein
VRVTSIVRGDSARPLGTNISCYTLIALTTDVKSHSTMSKAK